MTGAFYNDPAHKYGDTNYHYDDTPPSYPPSYQLNEDGGRILNEDGGGVLLESWGTVDADRLLWRLEFAWDGGLLYWADANGRNDADRLIDVSYVAGRPTFVNYDGVGMSKWTPGRLVVTLVNDDLRYDPNNASSPYYPNVKPGIFCRLGVRRLADDSCNWRFTGMITNVRCYQDPSDRANYAEISIVDGWGFLQGKNVYLPTVQNWTMTNILDSFLRAAGWPWGYSTDGGTLAFPYYWCGGDDAYTHIQQVASAQGDRIWLGGDGILHTEKRTATDTLIASITQDQVLVNIPRTNPWENVWNSVSVKCLILKDPADDGYVALGYWPCVAWGDQLDRYANTTLMSITSMIVQKIIPEYVIPASGTLVLEGKYSDGKKDYTLIAGSFGVFPRNYFISRSVWQIIMKWWTGSGGTGTQLSGKVSIDKFEDGGNSFRATLINTYNAPLYSNQMYIQSNFPIYTLPGNASFSDDRSAGATKKVFSINVPYLHGSLSSSGQAIAKYYADTVAVNRIYPTITIEHRHTLQFLHVSERVNIGLSKYSISSDYRVGQVQERWLDKNGQGVQTIITPEPYVVATS